MSNYAGFGQRLKESIKKSEYNQLEISSKLGIGKNTITRYINEEYSPACNQIEDICNLLGISIEWLITGKNNESDLSADERALIENYRSCSEQNQSLISSTAAALSNQPVPESKGKSSEYKIG